MAQQSLNTLKSWFERGDKPLANQFWDWMDSYWHKGELIPIDKVNGLETILNGLGTGLTKVIADTFYTPLSRMITINGVTQDLTVNRSWTIDITTGFKTGGNSFGAEASLGTNDNFALFFRTNNTERGRITSGGNWLIGIGTDSTDKFQVYGSSLLSGLVKVGAAGDTVERMQVNGVTGMYHQDAGITDLKTMLNLTRTSTGVPGVGFGSSIDIRLQKPDGTIVKAGGMTTKWNTASLPQVSGNPRSSLEFHGFYQGFANSLIFFAQIQATTGGPGQLLVSSGTTDSFIGSIGFTGSGSFAAGANGRYAFTDNRSQILKVGNNICVSGFTGIQFRTVNASNVITDHHLMFASGSFSVGSLTENPTAVLSVDSTTKGLAIPSMTEAQRLEINRGVYSLTITAQGIGYTTAAASFSGGGGSGAVAALSIDTGIGGKITNSSIQARGTGYTSAPTVTITGDGSGATAVANLLPVRPGTIVYQTDGDEGFYIYHSTGWRKLGGAFVNGGNTYGADASFGTNDSFPIIFKSAGVDRGRFNTSGQLLLNASSTTSTATLHVVGTKGISIGQGSGQFVELYKGINNGNFSINFGNYVASNGNEVRFEANVRDVKHYGEGGFYLQNTNVMQKKFVAMQNTTNSNGAQAEMYNAGGIAYFNAGQFGTTGEANDLALAINAVGGLWLKKTSLNVVIGASSTDTGEKLQVSGTMKVTGLSDYADDAAAAVGGVNVNQLYRTGNTVKIRLT